MSEEDDVVLDPEKLTIARLRSVIAEEGFPHVLPTGTARKSVYVHLYNEHVAPKLQKRAAAKLTRERQSLGGASAGRKLGLADSPSTAARKRSARRKTVSSLRPVSSEGSEDEENTPPQLSPNKRRTLLSPPPSTRKKTSAASSAATSTATPKTEQKPKRLAKRRKSLMSPTSALRTKKQSTKAEEEEETKKEEEEEFGSRVEGKKIVSPKARKKVSLSTNDSASSSSEEKQQSEEEEEAPSGLEPITSPEQARRFLRRRRSAIPYARERSPSKPDNVPLLDLPAETTSPSSSASTSTSTTATMKPLPVEHRRPSSRKGHWFWQLLNGLMIVAELSLLAMIVLFLFPSLLQYLPPLPFTITVPSTTTSESSGGSGWSFSSFFQPAAVPLPYCNTGDKPKLAGINPATQEHILSCRMCPRNGMCREGAFVGCKEGFAKSADGESCVEDEEITRAAHSMKEPAREILSYRRGLYECQPNDYSSPEIAEAELKQLLKERIAASASSFSFLWGDSSALLSSDAKFEAAFDRFKKEAKANEDQWDIHQRLSSSVQSPQLNFFTTRHITLPLMCELRLRLLEFKWYLMAATAVALLIPFLMWKRRRALAEAAEVDALVEEAKDLLVMQRQRALQQEEDSYKSSSWLPVTHVRDMLFHDDPVRKKRYIGSAKKEREMHRLWAQVVKAVSTDRRVSTCPQIVEGLQQTTWEWVSHIPEEHATQLLSPKRERGTRASLGRPSLQQLNFSPRSDYDDVNEPLQQQQQEHHHHEHQVGSGEELSHASSLYPRFG
ncbi:hypothetical protein QOT17_017442 [Balamuthia mandrillaris]